MIDSDSLIRTDELFDGRYRLLRLLSADGATADVWLAADLNTVDTNAIDTQDESSAMLVAIKIYRPKNALDIEGEQRFRDEYKIAHECRHPNLLPPEGFSIYKGMPYLIVPYCEAGSAEQLIARAHTVESVWKFISDVAAGLDRLHTNQPIIIHQDIKPANILIDNNSNFTITDFGISSDSNRKMFHDEDGNSGTLAYMAPERFDDNAIPIPQSDIWAFGATLCEILTGQVPFGEEGGLAQKSNNKIKPSLSHLPPEIRNLIKACLQLNPAKRPSAQKIMEIAQKKGTSRNHTGLVITILLSLLLISGIAYYFIFHTPGSKNPVTEKYSYEQAEQFLYDKETSKKGIHLLDSLAKENDYRAAYLLSRLYFNTSDPRDTAFYEKEWSDMRDNSEIITNNEMAHQFLFKAFTIDSSDPILLYQLGYDYHSGERRGCKRNSNYALWCYEEAEKKLENNYDPRSKRCIAIIQERKSKILSDDTKHFPVKPINP